MERLHVHTRCREQMLDITSAVRQAVRSAGWQCGVLTLFCPHTTCALTINEGFDPDVARDMTSFFKKLVPQHAGFLHVEGNADAHIKASMLGSSVQIIVEDGDIQLGTWQAVWLFEGDGPRSREIWMKWIAG